MEITFPLLTIPFNATNLDYGKVEYLISVPRVKQRGKQLQYRELAIISGVASIVQLQANQSVKLVEQALGKTLDDYSKREVPIFLNEEKLSDLSMTGITKPTRSNI